MFPISAYANWLDELVSMGVEFITYDDLFDESSDWDWESGYREEYLKWKKRRDPRKIYLLIQHDVDFVPEFTNRMIVIEADRGVKSNIFLLKELAGGYPSDSPYDDTPYEIDIKFLQGAESEGFVIGYHQNVVPRCNGTMKGAEQLFLEDVGYFKKYFSIDYFCPHGGRSSLIDGVQTHNFEVNPPKALKGRLRWVYNKYGLRFTSRWSDGGVRRMEDKSKLDNLNIFGQFTQNLQPGHRYFCLIHPQLWGWNIDTNYNKNLSNLDWYKKLTNNWGHQSKIQLKRLSS